jgi:hypothetical protein
LFHRRGASPARSPSRGQPDSNASGVGSVSGHDGDGERDARSLGERLHMVSRSRARARSHSRSSSTTSANLPEDLPEEPRAAARGEDDEAAWERRATLLAKGAPGGGGGGGSSSRPVSRPVTPVGGLPHGVLDAVSDVGFF